MTRQVGVWIDHREAFLVFIGEGVEAIQKIESGMEKHVRYSGRSAAAEGSADNQRDRQFNSHLNQYYDEVISHLGQAESIYLMGPGEAKGEFEQRLIGKGYADQIVGVETVDKMTENQISAKVRKHYQSSETV